MDKMLSLKLRKIFFITIVEDIVRRLVNKDIADICMQLRCIAWCFVAIGNDIT